ncbi:MAG: cytochrome c-type biogenesis protein CcmH [Yoonia sp.]|uniref:cytochrome c-type biogenesis protein n=1 Tax=Yoonia sp. TaxID=2212373 RepID=UPI00273E198B|nr:cytochrome c-type biogenesis protein [Yoonia sp.]MDP5085478.1 cytochrome c-type biogenesis protein CcmH [Yoonia sp.]MDP5361714.1 cytochrome c-type biogenesis protein CcmH [Paracoccaceae bacterium]
MKRLVLVLMLWAAPLWAVEPGEMLDDPVLEERARDLSQGLRCPVCRNESIDASNAALAKELRIVLRERIAAGDTDQEAVDFMVARYGEFVLLRPDTSGANLILWLSAPALLLIALGIGWSTIRSRKATTVALTDAEKLELEKILRS